MDYTTAVLITLITYKVLLIAIGIWSNKKNQSSDDYFIGGRTLGPWVAAISAAASASSAWSLLGMSGAAYAMGLPAIWIVPAVVLGYSFNWLWLAPRIQQQAHQKQSVTVTDFITSDAKEHKRKIILLSTFCIVFSFIFYIAAQFQAAGNMFAATFDMDIELSIALGTAIILIYTLLGGFWAVSITDTVQGIIMVVTAVLLPTVALFVIGGPEQLWQQMQIAYSDTQMSWFGEYTGIYIVAFLLGTAGIGVGNPGQPHVVNRLMAIKDEASVKQGAYIGIGWSVIIFVSMLLVGWSAKVLLSSPVDGEQALITLAQQLLPSAIAGIVVAATLSAIMSTADSQLLVAAGAISYDLPKENKTKTLMSARLTVAVMCLLSMLLAIYAPKDIFSRVLFAWNALGAAFGPVLIVLLMKRYIAPNIILASIFLGFTSTVIFHWLPALPGDVLERIVPFIASFLLCLAFSKKQYVRQEA